MPIRLPIRLLSLGLALSLAGLLVASVWSGCGDDAENHPSRTASRPASATGPTTAEVLAKDTTPTTAEAEQDLVPIPALGVAVTRKDPKTGELWQVYPNGLAYQDVVPGTGAMPRPGQSVSVQYIGTFPENGEVVEA